MDGTLSQNGIIPQSAKKSLTYLHQQGDLIFLCTGRCIGQMKDILKQIKVDGIIAHNGAYACYQDDVFFEQEINHQDIEALLQKKLCVGILSKNCYGVLQYEPTIMQKFCDFFHLEQPQTLKLEDIANEKIYSLGVYTEQNIANTINELKDLTFIQVCPYGYDIIPKGISKASPLKKLRKMFPTWQMIGFGDNYNDIDMLKEVDVAVVMASAPALVQSYANFVTKLPLEDGISYAIHELLRL